mmetsp:Transcript_10045/g.27453  ORF Transcript_10045/g.27453 Transcript_10045/m.27453 type:complete len:211 (-) Transcript_10045:3105-3737(-)
MSMSNRRSASTSCSRDLQAESSSPWNWCSSSRPTFSSMVGTPGPVVLKRSHNWLVYSWNSDTCWRVVSENSFLVSSNRQSTSSASSANAAHKSRTCCACTSCSLAWSNSCGCAYITRVRKRSSRSEYLSSMVMPSDRMVATVLSTCLRASSVLGSLCSSSWNLEMRSFSCCSVTTSSSYMVCEMARTQPKASSSTLAVSAWLDTLMKSWS